MNNNIVNQKEKNKKLIILGICFSVMLAIVLVLTFVLDTWQSEDKTTSKPNVNVEGQEETENNNDENQTNEETTEELLECKISKRQVTGNSESEKVLTRLNGYAFGFWSYTDYSNVSAKDIESSKKLTSVMYELGLFEENYTIDEPCYISKKEVDTTLKTLYADITYEPTEFTGSYCYPLVFTYNSDQEYYKVESTLDYGCGVASAYSEQIYDEVITDNKLEFKTRVLYASVDGVSYINSNNELENIAGSQYTETPLETYGTYANIFKWTFIKNETGQYVFDKIEKIK